MPSFITRIISALSSISLVKKLISSGYSRDTIVNKTGEFGVRGFIIDVFPVDEENPINSINLNLVKLEIFYKEQKNLYLEHYDDFRNELIIIEEALQSKIDRIPDEILKYNFHWIINLTEINLLLNNLQSLNINLERGLKINPKDQRLLLNKSIYLFHSNKTDDAISILENLIYIYPISFNTLSQILFKQESYEKIIYHGINLINNFNNEPDNNMYMI